MMVPTFTANVTERATEYRMCLWIASTIGNGSPYVVYGDKIADQDEDADENGDDDT